MVSATVVEASPSYLEVARREVGTCYGARHTQFILGDFAAIADTLPDAEVVTLDGVVYCCPDPTCCSEVARSNPGFTLFLRRPKVRAREAALAQEGASPGKSSSQRLTRDAIERANLPHRLWLPRLVRAAIISLHREASRAAKRFERCGRGC